MEPASVLPASEVQSVQSLLKNVGRVLQVVSVIERQVSVCVAAHHAQRKQQHLGRKGLEEVAPKVVVLVLVPVPLVAEVHLAERIASQRTSPPKRKTMTRKTVETALAVVPKAARKRLTCIPLAIHLMAVGMAPPVCANARISGMEMTVKICAALVGRRAVLIAQVMACA